MGWLRNCSSMNAKSELEAGALYRSQMLQCVWECAPFSSKFCLQPCSEKELLDNTAVCAEWQAAARSQKSRWRQLQTSKLGCRHTNGDEACLIATGNRALCRLPSLRWRVAVGVLCLLGQPYLAATASSQCRWFQCSKKRGLGADLQTLKPFGPWAVCNEAEEGSHFLTVYRAVLLY